MIEDDKHGHMPCLDGLRGLAALIVVLAHAKALGFASPIRSLYGAYGVLIFFVLSGFLMGDLHLRKPFGTEAVRRYVVARIARIVPIYYLVVTASFVIFNGIDHRFIYPVTNMQFARLLTFNGSTSVFWSIGPEFQFYFLLIPLWWLYSRLSDKRVFVLGLGGLAALSLITNPYLPGILVLSKFHIFSCGVLCALLRPHLLPRVSAPVASLLHGISALLLAFLLFTAFDTAAFNSAIDPSYSIFYGSLAKTLMAGFIVLSFSFSSPIGAAILGNPFTRLLGACSFSIYLLHDVVFYLLGIAGFSEWAGPTLGSVVALAAVGIVAYASWRWIEKPAQRWVKRRLLQSRPFAQRQPAV